MFKTTLAGVTLFVIAIAGGCAPSDPPPTTEPPVYCPFHTETIRTAAEVFLLGQGRLPDNVAELVDASLLHPEVEYFAWEFSLDEAGAVVANGPLGGECTPLPPTEPDPHQLCRTDQKTIETAAEAFRLEFHRIPTGVQELVDAKYLKRLPDSGPWTISLGPNDAVIATSPCLD